MLARLLELVRAPGQETEPTLIVQRLGQGFGFPEAGQDSLDLPERQERVAQRESEIDGLLESVTALGER